jgi:hypothetical protein
MPSLRGIRGQVHIRDDLPKILLCMGMGATYLIVAL